MTIDPRAVAAERASAAVVAHVGGDGAAGAARPDRSAGLARHLQGEGLSTAIESVFFGVALRGAAQAVVANAIAARDAAEACDAGGDAEAATSGARLDWVDAHPVAVALEDMPPGIDLAATLTGLDPSGTDDAGLVEAIAAWERMASWVSARQAVVVGELARRRENQLRLACAGDEVATRLGITRTAGEGKVADAWCLGQLPVVLDALERGHLDTRKAHILCDELLAIPEHARDEVCAKVLPDANFRTGPTLRAQIRRAALRLDPDAAERAHAKARADRRVELDPTRDGMAWLHAYLPGEQAVAIHTTLTAIADAQGPDDPRGVDARRADALVDVVTRWLDTGTTPDGVPLPTRQHRRPHLILTATAESILGLTHAPADLAGYGPISAATARKIAAASTWTPLLTDATTGGALAPGAHTYRPTSAQTDWVTTRDHTCTFPGCRVPAERCDIDHIDPYNPDRPPENQTTIDNLHTLCRHHHRLKTHAGWRVTRDPATGTTTWTAPTGHTYTRQPEPLVTNPTAQAADPDPPPADSPPNTTRPPSPDPKPPPF